MTQSRIRVPDFIDRDQVSNFARKISEVLTEEVDRFAASPEKGVAVELDLLKFKSYSDPVFSFAIKLTDARDQINEVVVTGMVDDSRRLPRYEITVAAPVFANNVDPHPASGRGIETMYFSPSGDASEVRESRTMFLERFSAKVFSEMENVRQHCPDVQKRWWKKS